MPNLSIIIPIYNKEKYVGKCISSLIKQKYSDFELVIVNDGSTDGSEDMIFEYQKYDSRIRYYKYANGGVAVARNRGLELASGNYVLFIDADDWIEEDYLSNIFSVVEKNPADLYIWGISKDRKDKSEIVVPDIHGHFNRDVFLEKFVREQYDSHRGLYGYISNKLVKKDFIDTYKIRFNEKIRLQEDYDFYLTCYSKCNDIYVFSESGYHYVADTSYSSGKITNRNYISMIDIHIRCRDILKQNNALTLDNDVYLLNAIKQLSYSCFWNIGKVSYSVIESILVNLGKRQCVFESFIYRKTINEKILSLLIIRKNIFALMVYVFIWNLYLKIRRL